MAKVKYSKRIATLDEGLLNPEAEEGKSEDDREKKIINFNVRAKIRRKR